MTCLVVGTPWSRPFWGPTWHGTGTSERSFGRAHDGVLQADGMPQFEEVGDAELDDLRQYLRQQADARRAAGK